MGSTLSDGIKTTITMVLVLAVVAIVVVVTAMVREWEITTRSSALDVNLDAMSNFETMAAYGKPVPMAHVVSSLDLYGTPETLTVQLEEVKNTMGGNPYPSVKATDTATMNELIQSLRKYCDKKVYVYYAAPNGYLQLCISDFKHE